MAVGATRSLLSGMTFVLDDHQVDIDTVAAISAVPSILDIACRMTGMGFAAVARVSEGRWTACAVRDEIGLGVVAGQGFPSEGTICHVVLETREPVVVADAETDEVWGRHPGIARSGLRSHASFPIILSDGSLFGTLCAADPAPHPLKTPETEGTFKLFAEVIGFHIEATRKLAEAQRLLEERRDADRRQRLLQRELAHRMKNTLAMVHAVVTQSLRNAGSLDEAAHLAGERIDALGRAQDMLMESNWETADVRDVVAAAIGPHLDADHRFEVSGPGADLSPQQGMGLALAIHELATNAVKYGALSGRDGRVTVAWDLGREGAFEFRWLESGGPRVAAPSRRGFGARLTERVVPTYFRGKAVLTYDAKGVEYRLNGLL